MSGHHGHAFGIPATEQEPVLCKFYIFLANDLDDPDRPVSCNFLRAVFFKRKRDVEIEGI